jgi:hypothetical protein
LWRIAGIGVGRIVIAAAGGRAIIATAVAIAARQLGPDHEAGHARPQSIPVTGAATVASPVSIAVSATALARAVAAPIRAAPSRRIATPLGIPTGSADVRR